METQVHPRPHISLHSTLLYRIDRGHLVSEAVLRISRHGRMQKHMCTVCHMHEVVFIRHSAKLLHMFQSVADCRPLQGVLVA